ncbi:MAG: hypothetical protein JNM56_26425 [Planctomycetia bacterium]|nr:hypothetical protein [Planctomycetia bacterium]
MIAYDRKHWFSLMFTVRGTILPRVRRELVYFFLGTLALCACHQWLFAVPVLNSLGHTVMGVTVGMLIVFRNNCSYDRFWEGRKLWGGIITHSRNLVRTAAAFASQPVNDLADLVTAYAHALKQHLRGKKDLSEIEGMVPADTYRRVVAADNPPTLLAWYIGDWVKQRHVAGQFDAATARALDNCAAGLIDCQSGCERILTTPLPFAYAVHIRQMLMLYLMTLPLVLLPLMGWFSAPAVAIIVFGLLGIETVGVEIEDPFGDEANDLHIEAFCAQIRHELQATTDAAEARVGGLRLATPEAPSRRAA